MSDQPEFKTGDIVNVTIEGALVASSLFDGIRIEYDGDSAELPLGPSVTIERADPAYWPPRSGDLLQHKNGARWFAVAIGSNVVFRNERDELIEYQVAWEARHDLTLIHREGATDATS